MFIVILKRLYSLDCVIFTHIDYLYNKNKAIADYSKLKESVIKTNINNIVYHNYYSLLITNSKLTYLDYEIETRY